MSDKSFRVLEDVPSHPLQGTMENLVRQNPALERIWRAVYEKSKKHKITPTLLNINAFKDCAEERAALLAIVKKFVSDEKKAYEEKQGKVKAPSASQHYGRVTGGEPTDVGSGNNARLRTAKHLSKVYAYDITSYATLEDERIVKVHSIETEEVTSFNSYTQLDAKTKEVVDGKNGIHLVPRHDFLQAAGRAKVENGLIYCYMGGGSTFVDRNYVDYGEEIDFHFAGINTYCPQVFDIKPVCKLKGSEVGGIYTRPTWIPRMSPKMTWKEDGVFYSLKMCDGKGTLQRRDGEGYGLTSANKMRLILDLELVGDEFVLLRVKEVGNLLVYHYLEGLELFVERIKVKIGDYGLRAPRRVVTTVPPGNVDGMVGRYGGMDYVFNYGIHLDIDASKREKLTKFLEEEQSVRKVIHQGNTLGMSDVRVNLADNGVAFVVWKDRPDKTRGDDEALWSEKFKLTRVEHLDGSMDEGGGNGMGFTETII